MDVVCSSDREQNGGEESVFQCYRVQRQTRQGKGGSSGTFHDRQSLGSFQGEAHLKTSRTSKFTFSFKPKIDRVISFSTQKYMGNNILIIYLIFSMGSMDYSASSNESNSGLL